MLNRVESDVFTAKNAAFSVGCSLAAGAVPYDIFWEINEKNFKAHLFENTYSKVVNFAISFQIDCADKCLMEAISALYSLEKTELLQDYNSLDMIPLFKDASVLQKLILLRDVILSPWKDPSLEQTDEQMMEQYHACQMLLLIISNVLDGRKLESTNQ
ncbi:hypothetical protein K1719_046667 [Acacia pycnantha]|nr:hypothetical protein K1719_046667 [Acacia pycnantha]